MKIYNNDVSHLIMKKLEMIHVFWWLKLKLKEENIKIIKPTVVR